MEAWKNNALRVLKFTALIFLILFPASLLVELFWAPSTSVSHGQFNFHIAAPGIWRCAQPTNRTLRLLKTYGLKSVINLREPRDAASWEKGLAEQLGIQYLNFPMDAEMEQDPEYVKKVLAAVEDPKNQPVLIHCAEGKDRTGLIIALHKLRQGNSLESVIQEMKMYGYDEKKYPELMKALQKMAPEIVKKS